MSDPLSALAAALAQELRLARELAGRPAAAPSPEPPRRLLGVPAGPGLYSRRGLPDRSEPPRSHFDARV